MKIIDYRTRDSKGRFAKKVKKFFTWTIIIFLIYGAGTVGIDIARTFKKSAAPVVTEESTQSELSAEEQAQLKEQYELAQKEAILKKQIAALDSTYKDQKAALDDTYKKQIAELDSTYSTNSKNLDLQFEEIRSKKVSFTLALKR